MKLFKKFLKLFKRKPKEIPIIQTIYEIPQNAIIGTVIGKKYQVKPKFRDLQNAFIEAVSKFGEIGIRNEAGKDLPALSIIIHPDILLVLELLFNDYMHLSFLDWTFRSFNFHQLIQDKRLFANEICIEDFTNISNVPKFYGLATSNEYVTSVGNFGLNRYCIYLEDNFKESLKK